MRFNAGSGSAEINFPKEMFPTEGFDGNVHDFPHVRILILDGNIKLALVAIELVVVAKPFVMGIKKIIGEMAGVDADNIWVHGTHAISTPHAPGPKPIGPNPPQPTEEEKIKRAAFTDGLNNAVKEACEIAVNTLRPAKMGVGVGTSDVNCSSRVIDVAHGMMKDVGSLDITDKNMTILKFEDMEGKTIAFVMSYCLMSNTIDNAEMDKGTRKISSDVPGFACNVLQSKFGAPFMFFMAAGADQKTKEQAMYMARDEKGERVRVDKGVAYGIQLVETFGLQLAEDAEKIANSIACNVDDMTIKASVGSVTVKNRPRHMGGPGGPKPGMGSGGPGGSKPGMGEGGPQEGPKPGVGLGGTQGGPQKGSETADLTILMARLGDVALVATNPELCVATELELKAKSPFDTTILISFTDGPKGIMADAGSFKEECAEGKSSFAEEGSAEKLVDKAIEMLGDF